MEYELIRSKRKTVAAQIKDGKLIVRAPLKMSEKKINEFLSLHREWIEKKLLQSAKKSDEAIAQGILTQAHIKELYNTAKNIIPERTAFYAERIGVEYGSISIRCQKTRWGSCSSKGNLNFNCLLMLTPPEVIDSVIVHELCHIKEMNHSKRFYDEVRNAYPEYDKWNKWLKENGPVIMNRAGK